MTQHHWPVWPHYGSCPFFRLFVCLVRVRTQSRRKTRFERSTTAGEIDVPKGHSSSDVKNVQKMTRIARVNAYLRLADHALVDRLTRLDGFSAHCTLAQCSGRVRPSATRRTAAYMSAQGVSLCLLYHYDEFVALCA